MGVVKKNVVPGSINPAGEVSIAKKRGVSISTRHLDGLLDVEGAAQILGISHKTLHDHVLHRRIDVKLCGSRDRVVLRAGQLLNPVARNTVLARAEKKSHFSIQSAASFR